MYICVELLKDDKDKDKKRAATQAAFKRKFKKNSDFWVYEKKIRLVVRKVGMHGLRIEQIIQQGRSFSFVS